MQRLVRVVFEGKFFFGVGGGVKGKLMGTHPFCVVFRTFPYFKARRAALIGFLTDLSKRMIYLSWTAVRAWAEF